MNQLFLDIIYCILYTIACLCTGAAVLKLSGIADRARQHLPASALLTTAFILGQGLYMGVWVLLAMAAWFYPQVVISVMVISVLSGGYFVFRWSISAKSEIINIFNDFKKESLFWKVLISLSLFTLLWYGVNALVLPPLGDAECTYMTLPKMIAGAHRMLLFPLSTISTQYLAQGEMHFAALLLFASPQGAKFFIWVISLSIIAMTVLLAQLVGVQHKGLWITLIILLNSTVFTGLIDNAKVDLVAAALGITAFYWAIQIHNFKNSSIFILTGFLTGLSIVSKASYLPTILPSIFLFIVWRYPNWNKEIFSFINLKTFLKIVLLFSTGFLISAIPNSVKNSIFFGQPLAPFFSTQSSSASGYAFLHPNEFESLRIILTYPFQLVFGEYDWAGGKLSPLVLAFLPLLFIIPKLRQLFKDKLFQISIIGLMGIVIWVGITPGFMLMQYTKGLTEWRNLAITVNRYFLPSLLLTLPVAAFAAEYALSISYISNWLKNGILFCLCIATISSILPITNANLRETTGQITFYQNNNDLACNLTERTWCPAVQPLEKGNRILMSPYYIYWLRSDQLQCIQTEKESRELNSIQDPQQKWEMLYKLGFKYLVLGYPKGIVPLSFPIDSFDTTKIPDWLNVSTVLDDGISRIYKLEASNPPYEPKTQCIEKEPGYWQILDTNN